jgi:uncharacterized cupredoxin-like copper-binding protein
MRVRLSLTALSIAIATLGALAGCGGDDNQTASAGSTTAPDAGGQTVNVSETEYKLDPSNPTVQPGTVSFKATNDGSVDHNLEVEGPEGEQELEQDLAPGESGTLTVDLSKPGKYEFYCPIGGHRDAGMEGEITVAGGGGAGNSGSAAGGGGSSAGGGSSSAGGGYGY